MWGFGICCGGGGKTAPCNFYQLFQKSNTVTVLSIKIYLLISYEGRMAYQTSQTQKLRYDFKTIKH